MRLRGGRASSARPAQTRSARGDYERLRSTLRGDGGARSGGTPPKRFKPADPVRRQGILTLVAMTVAAVFVGRLVDVQIVNAAPLAETALEHRLTTVTDVPLRADIVDRNGNVLATSVARYHLWVNQPALAKWNRTEDGVVVASGAIGAAKILAPILGVGESELAAALTGDKKFAYVAKNLTPETRDLIKAESIAGLDFEPIPERLYPNGSTGGNIVGFMAGDGENPGKKGMGGIERAYDDLLTGTAGEATYEKSARGTVIPGGVVSEKAAVPGESVKLTIDSDLQYYTQQRLAQAVAELGASGGTIVIMDPKSGEVYVIADSGSIDPSDPGATPAGSRGSGAVEDVFEPGSTAKTITMAAAIEEGVVTPTSQFIAPYRYTTENGQTFKDSHEHADQKLTTTGILVTSSNTGTIQVGQMLTDEVRYDYMRAFGLGETTGLGLPNESRGILRSWDKWDGRTKYATMYGQGVSVTAIQNAQVYSTIANGGVRVQPSIVKGTYDSHGTFTPRPTEEPVRVISESTAQQMISMLEEVTVDGTGKAAAVDGYRIAGKTGTAQAADENGELTRIVASFVGIAPADDPRLVISVVLYDPKSVVWGGAAAGPVFSDVATFALQALRVPPSTGEPTRYPTTWE